MDHSHKRAIPIRIKTDPHLPEERIPRYATAGAAGADLCAFLKEPTILAKGQRALIPTGLYFEIPEGFEVQIRPRSGLAYKSGITVANAPGTIDSDYRGEIKVLLINLGSEPFEIIDGMRVAQMVVAPVFMAEFEPIDELATTARNAGGFGHTGLSV